MSYDSYYDYDAVLGGVFFLIIVVALVLGLIAYIVSALIYFMASKTNGFGDVACIAWIPIINIYSLFLLTANGADHKTVRATAKKYTLIYIGLLIVSFIPIIGFISTLCATVFMIYFTYRLFYRWSGEKGKAVLYIILSFVTGGLFFFIYSLMRMNRPFVA